MKARWKADISKRKVILIVVISLFAGAITYFFSGLTAPLENKILDYHLKNTNSEYTEKPIIIVMIRDESMAQIGNWPWSTDVYADILDGPLSNAKTVSFNLDFMSQGNAEGDSEFSRAIKQHGNVVLGARYLPEEDKFIYPREELMESATNIGIYQTLIERDGISRKFQMYIEDRSGNLHPSYMHSIIQQSGYDIKIDESTHKMRATSTDHNHFSEVQLDKRYATWAANADTKDIEIYEYIDVVEGRVPEKVFDDAIVDISASNSIENRLKSTPDGDVYSSVRMLNQMYSVLAGFDPGNISPEALSLLVIAACLLCGFAALLIPVIISFVVPVILTVVVSVLSHLLFIEGILYLPIADILIWGWIVFLIIGFIQIRTVLNIVDYTTIPLQQTFVLNERKNEDGQNRLIKHIQGLAGIFHSIGLQLSEPLVSDDNKFIKAHKNDILDADTDNGFVVIKNAEKKKPKHRLVILHPKTEKEEPNAYTILAMSKLGSVYTMQSMASLIRNASLYYKALQYGEEKQKTSFNMMKCMVAAIDAKDPITAGHSQRVAQVALQIGGKMGFSDRELEELELAAIVHDIGKIGIQDYVLNKRGIFSSEEFIEMKTHPEKGISIMEPSELSENTIDAIINHHERPDGKGYPRGKKQNETGKYSKIIKISDVYDALLGERQYKKAWPLEKVCDLLYLGRSTEFDTEITDLFLDMIKPEGWTPPEFKKSKKDIPKETYEKYIRYSTNKISQALNYLKNAQEINSSYNEFVDFRNHNKFFDLEWGNSFYQKSFLLKRPYLLGYEEDKEYCHFALQLDNNLKGIVVYSFLRDYLTSGIVFIEQGDDGLNRELGEPIMVADNYLLWDIGKLFVLQKNDIPGYDSIFAFITKYDFGD